MRLRRGVTFRAAAAVVFAVGVAIGALDARGEPVAAATPGPASFRRFRIQPTWDDGLRYEVHRKHEPLRPEEWRLFPTDTLVTGRIGGRLHVDAATFAAAGHADDSASDVFLRRAFLNSEGEIALRWPIRYRLEVGIRSEEPYLNALWFEHRRPSGWTFTIGQLDAPLGRERLTSSNAVTFLERASPIGAFAPGTRTGVQLGHATDESTIAWTFGVFGDPRTIDGSHTTNGAPRAIGRVVWTPERWTDTAHGRVLELGVAGEYLLDQSKTVRYKAKPESAIPEPVVDTGPLDADHAFVHGLELAWQRSSVLLEAEHLGSLVDLDDEGPELVFGDYVALSALLTGEVRPYDRRRGTFGMPTPRVPFSFRERTWRGAWEVGARWAYLDLDAAGISGGRDHALSLGLTWYWNRHVRLMFDYGATFVNGSKPDGTVHVLQTRLQLVY